jgi:hypothetical protein
VGENWDTFSTETNIDIRTHRHMSRSRSREDIGPPPLEDIKEEAVKREPDIDLVRDNYL